MKVLVTGVTGFLGRAVAEYFQASGWNVVGTARRPADMSGPIEIRYLDLDQPLDRGLCEGVDLIVHTAALSSPWGPEASFFRTNADGTEWLMELAIEHKVPRFIYISSTSVYFSGQPRHSLGEDVTLPAKAVNAYAASKREAERRLEILSTHSNTAVTVLRPRAIFGPGETNLLPRLWRVRRRGWLPYFSGGRARISMTPLDFLVEVVGRVAVRDWLQQYNLLNVAHPQEVRVGEILDRLEVFFPGVARKISVPGSWVCQVARGVEVVYKLLGVKSEPPITVYSASLLSTDQTLCLNRLRDFLGDLPEVDFWASVDQTAKAFMNQQMGVSSDQTV